MGHLVYPECEVCEKEIRFGKVYKFDEYTVCESCMSENMHCLDPAIRDVVEDYVYDFREDARELSWYEED